MDVAQLGTLASGADFLMKENEKLVTDADRELMAVTYDDIGNIGKAEEYWARAIELSCNATQHHLHQRDHASFLFSHNDEEKGRNLFEQALTIELSDTDDDLICRADTFLLWAKLEKDFNNISESNRLIKEALELCKKIRHKEKNTQMSRLIQRSAEPL